MSVEGFEFHSTLFCRYASILSLLSNWNKFFLWLFALFHFLLKLCSFKRENLWRNISCLFCFALYTFANYHSFRRFCWREKYHLWFLNCNAIYWIHKKYPNRGYSCWLCQEKGVENLPSSAVLKISCKLILRTKWWTEKDFQYSKTRKLLHPHNLSFTKCQNHVLRQTKRGTPYLYQTFHIALITVIRSCDIHCDYMRSW